MRLIFLGFISMIVLLNAYVCARYTALVVAAGIPIWLFRTVYALFVFSFFSSIFFQDALLVHPRLNDAVTFVLTIYLGIFIFSFAGFFIADATRLLGNFLPVSGALRSSLQKLYAHGLLVFAVAIVLTCYGMWNAKQLHVKEYAVTIAKHAPIERLDLLLLSDLHLGTAIREKELGEIVRRANALSPDVVCIAGDLFDHATTRALMESAAHSLGELKSKYGVYFVFGNHEYYLGDEREAVKGIIASGVAVLADESVIIGDGVYIVGRKDATDTRRLQIPDLLRAEEIDITKPVILLDHQPRDLKTAEAADVDLMLSGHTHAGQITPFDLLTGLFNEMLYGIRRSGNFHAIVSSGTGVWRFPIRVGSRNEMVLIRITFKKD